MSERDIKAIFVLGVSVFKPGSTHEHSSSAGNNPIETQTFDQLVHSSGQTANFRSQDAPPTNVAPEVVSKDESEQTADTAKVVANTENLILKIKELENMREHYKKMIEESQQRQSSLRRETQSSMINLSKINSKVTIP